MYFSPGSPFMCIALLDPQIYSKLESKVVFKNEWEDILLLYINQIFIISNQIYFPNTAWSWMYCL